MEVASIEKGNVIVDESIKISDFEEIYLAVRKKEQQHYTNDEVALLPDISKMHPHYVEWQLRKRSCARLTQYLKKIKKPLNILEVGCGNGWLSSKMSEIENSRVIGADINSMELKQASTVFKSKENLNFSYGDIMKGSFANKQFDIIVFAASMQYFPSLSGLLHLSLKLLAPGGEIHLLDSPLYPDDEAVMAKQRTKVYCDSLGYPDMASYYFHHSFSELNSFNFRKMYDPFSITNKLLKRKDPFYWIIIR